MFVSVFFLFCKAYVPGYFNRMDGKLALAILAVPFVAVIKALKYIASNRVLLIVLIVAIGFFVIRGQFSNKTGENEAVTIPEYQKILPSKVSAPRIVQTTSRYFPYSTFQDSADYLTLTDYYVYDKDTWKHSTVPLPIEKSRIVKQYIR